MKLLGYPLYSSDVQLTRFLSSIRSKLFGHIHHIRLRGLSIRGLSVVVNFLVLSRIWFLLRVLTLPDDWIDSITSAITDLAVPFWPKPSRQAISRRRRQGGMSIVNIRDQALALQFTYLKRLAADPEDDDFLTPWLLQFFQTNTGHASVLLVLF